MDETEAVVLPGIWVWRVGINQKETIREWKNQDTKSRRTTKAEEHEGGDAILSCGAAKKERKQKCFRRMTLRKELGYR